MGLFDTVFLTKPIRCRKCGAEIDQVQTKAFEPALREYRAGDIIGGSPILNGVLREELYCASCNSSVQPVYFSVWHGLLVDTLESPEEAEAAVHSVDRAQLLDWLEIHQRRALQWHDRFSRLYGELQNYHDFQTSERIGDAKFFRITQYVEASDPLGELIRANRPMNPEDETEVERENDSA